MLRKYQSTPNAFLIVQTKCRCHRLTIKTLEQSQAIVCLLTLKTIFTFSCQKRENLFRKKESKNIFRLPIARRLPDRQGRVFSR